jgi:ketosteroid isomerase-like protein
MNQEQEILQLNQAYVEASLAGDVAWYKQHLADEFMCIESDGSLLDKTAFLEMTAKGSELARYDLEGVDVRFYGDVALVRCTGKWMAKNGIPGLSRYVDVYARFGDEWKCVSAHITRPRFPTS